MATLQLSLLLMNVGSLSSRAHDESHMLLSITGRGSTCAYDAAFCHPCRSAGDSVTQLEQLTLSCLHGLNELPTTAPAFCQLQKLIPISLDTSSSVTEHIGDRSNRLFLQIELSFSDFICIDKNDKNLKPTHTRLILSGCCGHNCLTNNVKY